MGKSLDNYVGITDEPAAMFGKLMSIPDALMPNYFTYASGWGPDDIDDTIARLDSGALKPVEAKRTLARAVIDLYHPEGSGAAAETEFDRVFKQHARPTEIPECAIAAAEFDRDGLRLAKALALCGLVSSNKAGRRMIEQGAVKCNDEKVTDPDRVVTPTDLDGATLQVGRRNWAVVRVG
jgi:tyrosyl-tRNA synthetase